MSRNIPENLYSIKSSNFDAMELPQIKSIRGKDYMYYGNRNLFPQELIRLYDTSAIHHTCVDAIRDGIIGEGIEVFGSDYINTKGDTIDEVFAKISLDFVIFGAYSLNVIWNKEGSRIVDIFHLPVSQIRSGKMDEDGNINEYFYSSDWAKLRQNPAVAYKAFDPMNTKKDDANQVYYCKQYTPGQETYGQPSYIGSLNDIELDHRISVYHNSNISNGLSPSLFINFRNGIPSENERNVIHQSITETFSGETAAGKFFLGFSEPGKEMEVQTIDSANDDYYVVLNDRVTSRILTGHRISSGLLLGVANATGFSSNADEIKVAYTHFESTVVEPKRKKILSTFGYILRFFGMNVSLTVEPKTLVIEETVVNDTETKIVE